VIFILKHLSSYYNTQPVKVGVLAIV